MKIKDRNFKILLSDQTILNRIKQLAISINKEHIHDDPIFIAVLNGSFMFASDLLKEISIPCEIQFIKVASYLGTQSTGEVQSLIGLNQHIEGRNIIVLEDIIDSGLTIDYLLKLLVPYNTASVKVCTLLLKPEALKVNIKPDYIGFEVDNHFLVGYGLDYDGYGRNLKHIYVLD